MTSPKSSLPEWVGKIDDSVLCQGQLIDALSLAWEALEKCNSPETDWENGEIGVGNKFRTITRNAMDAIRKLGEGR